VHRFGWGSDDEWTRRGITIDAPGIAQFYRTNAEARAATGGLMPYTFCALGDGEIQQAWPLSIVTPHAARFNVPAVGFAMLGDFRSGNPPTSEQYDAAICACAGLLRYFPRAQLVGHSELDGASRDKNKVCPGTLCDMDRMRRNVNFMNSDLAGRELVEKGMVF